MKLVIVESPTKARTIKNILKNGFKIVASNGHIRDLPKKEFGIDIKNNFKQKYIILPKAKKFIKLLKQLLPESQKVILATDEDREGEAIAWHIKEALKLNEKKIARIVFHEITSKAILSALEAPRGINYHFVDSYKARRVLDRIVGYKLSPFLWRKIAKGLSAGRVQSPALRLICEREKEIKDFKPITYFNIYGIFETKTKKIIKALLVKINKKPIKKPGITDKIFAENLASQLKNKNGIVIKIKKTKRKISSPPPFKTSTLQQEAFKKLGFSSKKTMFIAQRLYEGIEIEGVSKSLITYHRTDSLNLSKEFLKNLFEFAKKNFKEQISSEPKLYKTKSKLAFEAHEAIRPIDIKVLPDSLKNKIEPQFYKLYDLIWRRTLASQMKDLLYEEILVEIEVDKKYIFQTKANKIISEGFSKIYKVFLKEQELPKIEEQDILKIKNIEIEQNQTKPPSRFNDAKLVKTLEKFGIGRPSTYATIISTLLDRGYVNRTKNKKLIPTELGMLVNEILTKHFKKIVDYNFTANLEEKLDLIAQNKINWTSVIRQFYFNFEKELKEKFEIVKKEDIFNEKIDKLCPNCKVNLVARFSKYGKFYGCPNFPKCRYILK